MALVLLRYIRFSFIGVILIWIDFAEAVPIVPQFRTGTSQTTSTSEQVINETITSHQYRTGYSYSASGHNIESETGYINPTPTTTNEQTVRRGELSLDSTKLRSYTSLVNHKRWSSLLSTRNANYSRIRHDNNHNSSNKYKHNHRNYNYLWAVAIILCPARVLANTTVASPSSNAQGVVNNNATMITPSSMPSFRMSQGIVCASPSLTITPYVTDSWSFALPRENVTRTPIYDEETGEIIYYSEIPRFEKDTFNLNYGISAQFNIPLGKSPALCHKATQVNIEAQELLIKKTKMEISLYRLEMCAKQAKLGAAFRPGSPSALTCEDIIVNIPPNQVIPHTHKLK